MSPSRCGVALQQYREQSVNARRVRVIDSRPVKLKLADEALGKGTPSRAVRVTAEPVCCGRSTPGTCIVRRGRHIERIAAPALRALSTPPTLPLAPRCVSVP